MQITLNDDEIREILLHAMREKTAGLQGTIDDENCYFSVMTVGEDLETVEFTVNL